MLTVDYGRLGLSAGERLLDVGCGAGRHAAEGLRNGSQVVAVDQDAEGVAGTTALLAAMVHHREVPADTSGAGVRGSVLALPFADGCFDRIVAAEVLEHVVDDGQALAELARVLRPGGVLAISVPRWLPELVCWALSDEYHLVPGGHVRIYREGVLGERLHTAGLAPFGRHHAHALHAPYWWLRCAVGVRDDRHPVVRAYHAVLVWDITRRPFPLRVAERLLQPLIGKSLVVYARKPEVARVSVTCTPDPEASR